MTLFHYGTREGITMITFAVCDDEAFMLRDFTSRLSGYMEERQMEFRVQCYTGGKSLLDSKIQFDMVFLDIQMESPDGLETARLLRRRGYQGILIFITVLKECVFDSFEVQAFDFLVKPIDPIRFRRTMDRSLQFLEQAGRQNIVVHRGRDSRILSFSEIVYCEVIARKIYLHLRGGETVAYYDKLEELEKRMDKRFFRCHRSYLVNLDFVRGCRDGLVMLAEGGEIPVSRLRERDFTKALLLHMKERRRDGMVSSFI